MDRFEQIMKLAPAGDDVEIVYERVTIRKCTESGSNQSEGDVPIFTPLNLNPFTNYQAPGTAIELTTHVEPSGMAPLPTRPRADRAGKNPKKCLVRVRVGPDEEKGKKLFSHIEDPRLFDAEDDWTIHLTLRADAPIGTEIIVGAYNEYLGTGSESPAKITIVAADDPNLARIREPGIDG